jgi:DNA replication protein DnaC
LKLQQYLDNFGKNKLFVITGPSGAGKSTLMANIAKNVIIFSIFFKLYKQLFLVDENR